MRRLGRLTAGFCLVVTVARAAGVGPVPVIFQSAPGRFEVAAIDATAAQAVVAQAEDAWRWLTGPLALPAAFSSPVFVRLVPVAEWSEPSAWRVIVEAGGVVSLRLRWAEPMPETVVRRALVRALLLRMAVARKGVTERSTAPRWLEEAGVGWWRTHAEAAQLDALQQQSAHLAPPALAELLAWPGDAQESPEFEAGAIWLLTFLQEESGRTGEWRRLLGRLLGGESPTEALAASFPGRFTDDATRELWWQTGWHHVRRAQALPSLEARESRVRLEELTRFVFAEGGGDTVVPLRDVLARGGEPAVAVEVARRSAALNRLLPGLHPFYRNAGLSLASALEAGAMPLERREQRCAAFESDWRDAIELAATTTAALDAMEAAQAMSSNK